MSFVYFVFVGTLCVRVNCITLCLASVNCIVIPVIPQNMQFFPQSVAKNKSPSYFKSAKLLCMTKYGDRPLLV